jgi:hypothetical protein
VVICTPFAGQQSLQQLQPIKFVAAFCSTAAKQEAEQLWQELGRAGPPLFLKVRVRDSLQELEQVGWFRVWGFGWYSGCVHETCQYTGLVGGGVWDVAAWGVWRCVHAFVMTQEQVGWLVAFGWGERGRHRARVLQCDGAEPLQQGTCVRCMSGVGMRNT